MKKIFIELIISSDSLSHVIITKIFIQWQTIISYSSKQIDWYQLRYPAV